MNIKKILLLSVIICSSINNSFGKDYILKWFNNVKVLDHIEFQDKSKYQVVLAKGSWEDNEGNYGFLKCIGPNLISFEGKVELEAFCEGYDNKKNYFFVKLIRKSDYDVGIGETLYLDGSGRYKSLVNKKCKYAIKYIAGNKNGFYRHICK